MKQNETTAPDDARFVCTTILDEALIVRWNDFHFRHIQTRSRWVSMACGMIIMIIGAVMFIMNLDQSSIDLLSRALRFRRTHPVHGRAYAKDEPKAHEGSLCR